MCILKSSTVDKFFQCEAKGQEMGLTSCLNIFIDVRDSKRIQSPCWRCEQGLKNQKKRRSSKPGKVAAHTKPTLSEQFPHVDDVMECRNGKEGMTFGKCITSFLKENTLSIRGSCFNCRTGQENRHAYGRDEIRGTAPD